MSAPLISIIIPCHNSGKYLPEAVQSVRAYGKCSGCEIIIVNDGSTDAGTLEVLRKLKEEGCNVIDRENGGPAAARNTGARSASSEFLLFLDSDNRIRPEYIDASIQILSSQKEIGVVHGRPVFFGESTTPRFETKAFDKFSIYLENYIDMCAVVRKEAWESVGGIDEDRVMIGFEDWDFWIRIYNAGWTFHFLNKPMFEYRVTSDSLVSQIDEARFKKMQTYMYTKHLETFRLNYKTLNLYNNIYKSDQQTPFRSFLKFFIKKYFRNNSVATGGH